MQLRKTTSLICTVVILLCCGQTNAQTWDTVGNRGMTYGYTMFNFMTFDNNDTPYVAYRDNGITDTKVVVKKFNGTSWDTVGLQGFSAGYVYSPSLAFNSSNTPYIAFRDGGNGSKATVKTFNGSAWVDVGTGAISSSVGDQTSLAFDSNDTPYVAFRDFSNSLKATVKKFDGSNWVVVGSAGFTADWATEINLAFDSNDTLYMSYIDKNSSDKATVMKFNGSSWVVVGSAGFSAGKVSFPRMAIDGNDIPYVAYQDHNNEATVMRYSNGSWDSVGNTGFSAGTIYYMSLAIDSNNNPYVAFRDNTSSSKVTVMRYDGNSWSVLGYAGISQSTAGYPSVALNSNNEAYLFFADAPISSGTVMKYTPPNTWDGNTWSMGAPDSTTSVEIASNTAPATFSCNNLTISSGMALNTGTNNTVTIYGDLTNNGNGVTGQGTICFDADGTAAINGDTLEHEGTIIVESGCTLNTNNLLRLTSDASNTGSIGESNGTISGTVYAQRYNIGKRCYRLYAHPFNSSIALNQLTDEIDITGSGGAANGFTPTASSAPSAYWFDPTTADTSSSSVNSGWTAFTSANTNSWEQHQLLLLFLRGTKGEGLTGGSYTPSAATFEAAGTVNQGTQIVTLTKGANTDFAAVGNPFPSGVQMQNVTPGANVGANYYVFDASSGADGAYVTNPFSLSYVLPAYAGFFTTITATTSITFEEADKASGGDDLFKGTATPNMVELQIADSNTKWDRLLINLDDNSMAVEDKKDGKKLYNPNLDFYTLSQDDVRLAVDVRPYNDGKNIPLGLTAYNRHGKYVIRTGIFDIPAGTKLVLNDKYLNKQVTLNGGAEYWFDVTGDTLSQGDKRFEINMIGQPTTGIIEDNERIAGMYLSPNPAGNSVKVSFEQIDGDATVQLTSLTGKVLYKQEIPTSAGSVTIPLNEITTGMFIVELHGNNARFTQKLIKE